jgi:hypothetical protein
MGPLKLFLPINRETNKLGGPAQSASEFWKEYDAQHPAEKK